jgi:hypothetical protein
MPPTTLYKQLDTGLRIHTAYDLENKLAAFITQLFTDTYLLDNPKVNFFQTSEVSGAQPPTVRYVGANSRFVDCSPDYGVRLEVFNPTTQQWTEMVRYVYPHP